MFIIRFKLLHLNIKYHCYVYLGGEFSPIKSLNLINIFFKMNNIVLTETDSINLQKEKDLKYWRWEICLLKEHHLCFDLNILAMTLFPFILLIDIINKCKHSCFYTGYQVWCPWKRQSCILDLNMVCKFWSE